MRFAAATVNMTALQAKDHEPRSAPQIAHETQSPMIGLARGGPVMLKSHFTAPQCTLGCRAQHQCSVAMDVATGSCAQVPDADDGSRSWSRR